MTREPIGMWCRKGHLIEPGDDQGQCEAVGLVYVVPAGFDWGDNGWEPKSRHPSAPEEPF